MMSSFSAFGFLTLCALLLVPCLSFSVDTRRSKCFLPQTATTTTTTSLEASRRSIFATAGSLLISGIPMVAFADFDDLAMPSGDDAKKADEDAMAERIRRKRELQKKASSPKNFSDNFAREQEKQKEMSKQSQSERRNAMCEELGRGC